MTDDDTRSAGDAPLDPHPARRGKRGQMDERASSDRRRGERRKKDVPIDEELRSG